MNKQIINNNQSMQDPNHYIVAQPEPSRQAEESELVRSLREQVHRAFLQINEMEKFQLMESQHTAHLQEENQTEWKRKEEHYKAKIVELENKIKERQPFSKCGPVVIDLGDLDDSHFFDEIEYVRDEVRDSGLEHLQSIFTEHEKNIAGELDERRKVIDRLRGRILVETNAISQPMADLINMCNELCLQNCNLKEELKNLHDNSQVSKCKIQQAYNLLSRFKQNQAKLKAQASELAQENENLKKLYERQVNKKEQISSTLAVLEEKAQKNANQNIKLQEIIKDQSSRLEILSRQHSVLNQNCELNSSNSRANQSNVSSLATSTLSNFLNSLKSQGNTDKPQPRKYQRISCDTPKPTNVFKKKPMFQFRKSQN